MIYHSHFDQTSTKASRIFEYTSKATSKEEFKRWADDHNIPGRMMKFYYNRKEFPVLEYQSAGTHTRLIFNSPEGQVNMTQTTKSPADAFNGIHRNQGYHGGVVYAAYAILLDILAISLVLFIISGVFLWMKILKSNTWAWIIFLAGFVYFISVVLYIAWS
ncbi:PepSY-associated TM helix domain-containing protein [Membranicola marinus]|uniref:PepSY-associated TM helix domain-containing protein n=1 Tax=Membranihabitans marinus TaxID=1227546 RepID=A0A953HWU3_9BACT|nr:PepSY-associated TM helix domain-containing protein [Membranihabitans marinus]MBY5959616.1 PepSY-associated TM helix domain-containing protein [Membranihabitans marinus]